MNASAFYIGTPVLNRNRLKEQNTSGMFINTVPLLVEINSEAAFTENLRRMTERTTAVLRHQHYNYEDLLAELRSSEGFGERLYDVMLSYQNAKTNAEGFASEWYYPGMQTENLQIHIDDHDGTGELKIHYDYRLDRFSEKEIERMHGHIFNLFSTL